MNDIYSLSHAKWNCKYHIVFAPKYRRKIIYGDLKIEIGKILRQLCDWKEVKIIEAELCPDHVHMLVEIPPKMSVSSFVGYLKGKSSLQLLKNTAHAILLDENSISIKFADGNMVRKEMKLHGSRRNTKSHQSHSGETGA